MSDRGPSLLFVLFFFSSVRSGSGQRRIEYREREISGTDRGKRGGVGQGRGRGKTREREGKIQ